MVRGGRVRVRVGTSGGSGGGFWLDIDIGAFWRDDEEVNGPGGGNGG